MRWAAIPYVVCCATLSAQINQLATTSDGSVLYLSGTINLLGTIGLPYGSVFRYRDSTRTFEQCVFPGKSSNGRAFAGSTLKNISADGSLIAWGANYYCTLSPPYSQQCLDIFYGSAFGEITDSAFLQGNEVWKQQRSAALLSANGKFALLGQGSNMDVPLFGPFQILSLADGNITNLNTPITLAGTQAVSDTGAVVLNISQSSGSILPVVYSTAASIPLKFSHAASRVALSRDGQHIVYVSMSTPGQLFYYEVASETEQLVATAPLVPIARSCFILCLTTAGPRSCT